MDMWINNIMYRPAPEGSDRAWDFQLIDFSLSLPHWMRRYAFRNHVAVSKGRSPTVACWIGIKSKEERSYCRSPYIASQMKEVCDGVVDMYPLGLDALQVLSYWQQGYLYFEDIPRDAAFDVVLDLHEHHLLFLEEMRGKGVNEKLLDMISQMMDLDHFNRTLVCHE